MKPVFADTVSFLALLNPADQFHRQALAFSQRPPGPLLTTEFVLIEVGDAMSRSENRPRYARLLQLLRQQPDVEILPATSARFQHGCELHAQRPDKDWSLTDCLSFLAMQERSLEEALTSDHHFEQAGFRPPIKP